MHKTEWEVAPIAAIGLLVLTVVAIVGRPAIAVLQSFARLLGGF